MCPEFDPEAFREFERQGHDRLAESYADVFTPITGLAVGYLLDAASVKTGMRVLDVACGPGNVCQAAIRRGAEPLGIDLSSRMVEIAGRIMPDVKFRVADVERLPFEQASFEAVVCNFGLGHFLSPEASVAECVRVLVPCGVLAFAWWDSLQKQRLQAIFRAALGEASATPSPRIPTGHDVFRFSNTAALRGLLEGAGLEQVSISDHETSIKVEDAQHLWEIGMGSLAVTSSIILDADAATQSAIRLAFDRICDSYRDGSTLRIPIAFKIGVGRKP
jgi:SAM-dependent methyltransferase